MASRSQLRFFLLLILLTSPSDSLAVKLRITSNPPGATVEIDDVSVGTTPLEKDYPGGTGSHAIVLKFPGRADWKRTLEVLKSSKVTFRATLDRAPRRPLRLFKISSDLHPQKKRSRASLRRPANELNEENGNF